MSGTPQAELWDDIGATLDHFHPVEAVTRVVKIVGLLIESGPLRIPLGSRLVIRARARNIPVELVGFSGQGLYLMPFGSYDGIAPGDKVVYENSSQTLRLGDGLLGRVLDGEGILIDDKGSVLRPDERPIYREAPPALSRRRLHKPFYTGVRAWDAFMTIGRGQRVGIFAGTGVGKSILLGMIARGCSSDVNVLALIGERGHEVREFIENVLGEEGMRKTVIVVATSDQTPLMRKRAAFVAMAVAEYFAARGKQVLFLMDSITRMAMAARELGLSIGEPPTAKGYPPSVFSMLPRLLERSGNFGEGSITSIISVLLEGDDLQDPIGDAVRGILDGHIVLSRDLAERGHYPAIDVPQSLSRWMNDIAVPRHRELSRAARRVLAEYRDAEDLLNVGAYVQGSNPDIDEAVRRIGPLRRFMLQDIHEKSPPGEIVSGLEKVMAS